MRPNSGKFASFFSALASAILLCSFNVPTWSQSTSTGTVSGQVTDQQGAAVAGAQVKLMDVSTNTPRTTTSNETGRYSFINVQPGQYNVEVSKAGFRPVSGREPNCGLSASCSLSMRCFRLGRLPRVIEVTTAPGAELQTTNATVGTTLSGASLVYLPNLSREASSLAIFQPGTSPEGSVAGAMYDQNTFQLDGGNNSNDMDGSMNVYTPSYASNGAPTGVMPTPIESIEEFKVGTANQTADFNGSSGSQIQMVTKRGTDSFPRLRLRVLLCDRRRSSQQLGRQSYARRKGLPVYADSDHPHQPVWHLIWRDVCFRRC